MFAGLSSGHIPGSISIPVSELLDPDSKAFLPAEELKRVFETKGVDPTKPIVSSCGTGVTAVVIDVALHEAGFSESSRKVYDGSWTLVLSIYLGEFKLIETIVNGRSELEHPMA